jgi:type IV pilus assembly protein PilW
MTAYTPRQRGFTLVELMIATTIGLLVLAGMTTMFVSNNNAQAEIERANRQIENGRYSIQLLADDARNAGFYGEFDPSVLTLPAAVPDPCSVSLADIKAALPLYLQGYDNVSGGELSCVKDVRAGTDIVVVRHASNCVIDTASCVVNSAGAPYFQASWCDNPSELGSGNPSDFYALDSVVANLTRHMRDCTQTAGSGTLAPVRYLQIHIYFIANNDRAGDGIPTLKRVEVGNKNGVLSVNTVALAEGVENLQMEYGLDTSKDGSPDVYTTDPAAYGGCATAACAVANWNSVVSAKINLLTRTTQADAGYTDNKSYVLGAKADGSPNTISVTDLHYKRHVFKSTVVLPNPSGRRAS